jgi:hypothetical protein
MSRSTTSDALGIFPRASKDLRRSFCNFFRAPGLKCKVMPVSFVPLESVFSEWDLADRILLLSFVFISPRLRLPLPCDARLTHLRLKRMQKLNQ